MNIIALLFYLAFLMIYITFNGYIIKRIFEMQVVGDKTKTAVYLFTGVVTLILIVTFVYLATMRLTK